MKNGKWALCVFAGTVLAANIAGAETLRLTLEEAMGLGIKNSTTIQSKGIAVGAAKAALAASRASYYPSVSAGATYTHLFKQPSLDIGFGTIYTAASDPISLSLDVSQTVTNFGKNRNGVKIGEKNVEMAEMDLKEEMRKLAVEIRKAFYGYILAKEIVRINEETLRFKEETLSVARKKYDAGIVSDFEVMQAETDVANFQPQVISAKNQVSFALLAVIDLLGVKSEEGFDVDLIGELKPEYRSFDKQEIFTRALENKYEVQSFRKNMEIAQVVGRIAAAANKPTVAAFGNYTLSSGYDSTTGKNKYTGEDSWSGNLVVGASVQMPLSALFPWSKERANIVKDKLDYEQLKLSLSSLESGVRLNIENLLLRLEEEKAKIISVGKSVELTSKLYQRTRERYSLGFVSNIELRDVEISRNNAQLGYAQAIYNYTLALISLLDAVGTDSIGTAQP
jgi:outer membrane protein